MRACERCLSLGRVGQQFRERATRIMVSVEVAAPAFGAQTASSTDRSHLKDHVLLLLKRAETSQHAAGFCRRRPLYGSPSH